jgi:hypothetical protein
MTLLLKSKSMFPKERSLNKYPPSPNWDGFDILYCILERLVTYLFSLTVSYLFSEYKKLTLFCWRDIAVSLDD